jgi:asparagine synthase (glutamine-hydrolysing)
MAFSIESRVPFLDYRLIESVYSWPDEEKIRSGQTKHVMREALKGILPKKILSRQDKIGFATPEEYWLKNEFKGEIRRVFASRSFSARPYWQASQVQELFEDFLAGKIKNYAIFWRLYNLEIWFRIFIDR